MDISSEIIHSLLPVYLVTVLGTSMLTVGFIEGIAEATASITKVFSGALSDWLGKRKFLTVLGYGLAAFTKPVFPLASSIGWLVAARFIDRIGKGIRQPTKSSAANDASRVLRHFRNQNVQCDSSGVFQNAPELSFQLCQACTPVESCSPNVALAIEPPEYGSQGIPLGPNTLGQLAPLQRR